MKIFRVLHILCTKFTKCIISDIFINYTFFKIDQNNLFGKDWPNRNGRKPSNLRVKRLLRRPRHYRENLKIQTFFKNSRSETFSVQFYTTYWTLSVFRRILLSQPKYETMRLKFSCRFDQNQNYQFENQSYENSQIVSTNKTTSTKHRHLSHSFGLTNKKSNRAKRL